MRKRVLLAEDEPNIVESLRFLLGRAGFDVTVCENGKSALRRAISSRPDVMVLDVMLPGMDGLDVLREVRAKRTCEQLPVLVLTAKGQREDRERALAIGANLFISKPFANSEVVSAVEHLAHGQGHA